MGMSCSTHGTQEMHTTSWLENLNGRHHLKDLSVIGRIISEWSLGKKGWEHVNWIHLAQDRAQWRVFVNTVMNLRVP
jgi:hypothetical protein